MTITRQVMNDGGMTDVQKEVKLKEALARARSIMREVSVKVNKNSTYYREIFKKSEAVGCLPDDYYYYGQNQRARLYASNSYYYNSNLAEITGALSHLDSKKAN